MSDNPIVEKELNFLQILERNKAFLKLACPSIYEKLDEVDPAMKLLGVSAYIEGLNRAYINTALSSNIVSTATGENLDNLALFYGLTRKVLSEGDNTEVPPLDPIYETDDEFRARVLEAPFGFSVAGPKASYQYYGKGADIRVKDVNAISLLPAIVNIYVLSYEHPEGGTANGEASDELVDIVKLALNDEYIRPMGDLVRCYPAEIIEYTIEVVITPACNSPSNSIDLELIKNNLQSYAEQNHKIGSTVAQSGIYANSHIDGVKSVEIISPVSDIVCTYSQAPYCTDITVTLSEVGAPQVCVPPVGNQQLFSSPVATLEHANVEHNRVERGNHA